jgi:hypothetical protein
MMPLVRDIKINFTLDASEFYKGIRQIRWSITKIQINYFLKHPIKRTKYLIKKWVKK